MTENLDSTMTMLTLSWSTSRGRDTYGYNICKLTTPGGKTYKTMGGGYDMVGTVLADWLCDVHQDRLRGLSERAYYDYKGNPEPGADVRRDGLYGLVRAGSGVMRVDGACGVDSVVRIAEAAGVRIKRASWDKRGNTTAYLATVGE
jgi:hypothetical protein